LRAAPTLGRLLALAWLTTGVLAAGPARVTSASDARGLRPISRDTLRSKVTRDVAIARSALDRGAVVPGYFSIRGLPPIQGQFSLSNTGLVFLSRGGAVTRFPLVGPLRQSAGRQWRPSTVSLAYIDEADGRSIYVFRIDAGVFETERPGVLLEVASHPVWLDSLDASDWVVDRPLVNGRDTLGLWKLTRTIGTGSYADSLYALFGRPRTAIGLIGRRGRLAGRLGEYVASRDSLALDPSGMTNVTQLRHALAHELGHRWQARARVQLATLWSGVKPIRDPKRYGYGDISEHQAEAIAFAINFLQTTAKSDDDPANSLTLLDHYELLVPGTRTMARYLSLQPIYRHHPLRPVLTTARGS
jgi:hypothetical protein